MSLILKQALAIGNDAYPGENYLSSCINDATDVSNCLRSIGFNVYGRADLDYYSMQSVTQRFIRSIQPGSIALFYFSGHGIQSDGYNLLIPTDNDNINPDNVKETALSAERLIYDMHLRRPRVAIVILDCCRTYWGPGSLLPPSSSDSASNRIKLGLAPMQIPPSTIVAYSCAAESTSSAKSKNNRNSMYTYHLLNYLATPNVDIDHILKCVAIDVQRDTNNQQIPYRYSSCNENIYLFVTQPINGVVWPGVMQSYPAFLPFKHFSSNLYSHQYFQRPIDRYHHKSNYHFNKQKRHRSSNMYNPSKFTQHPFKRKYPSYYYY